MLPGKVGGGGTEEESGGLIERSEAQSRAGARAGFEKIFERSSIRRSSPGNETMEKRFVPRGGASRARFRGALSFLAMVVIIYHHWCGVASLEGPRAFVFFAVTLLHEKRFTRR
jgi:hypothetical protein